MDTLQEDACATAEQRSRIYGKIQGSPPQRIDGDGAWLEQTTATDRTAGYSAAVASSPGCVRSYDTRCCKICRVRCEPVRVTRQSNQARFAAKHHRNSSVPAHLNTRRHAEGRPVSPVAIAGTEASATRFGCPRPKPGSETRKKSRLSLLRACAAPEMPRTARARGLRTWLRKTAVAAGFGRVAARPESAPLQLPGWEHARQSAVAGRRVLYSCRWRASSATLPDGRRHRGSHMSLWRGSSTAGVFSSDGDSLTAGHGGGLEV